MVYPQLVSTDGDIKYYIKSFTIESVLQAGTKFDYSKIPCNNKWYVMNMNEVKSVQCSQLFHS